MSPPRSDDGSAAAMAAFLRQFADDVENGRFRVLTVHRRMGVAQWAEPSDQYWNYAHSGHLKGTFEIEFVDVEVKKAFEEKMNNLSPFVDLHYEGV